MKNWTAKGKVFNLFHSSNPEIYFFSSSNLSQFNKLNPQKYRISGKKNCCRKLRGGVIFHENITPYSPPAVK